MPEQYTYNQIFEAVKKVVPPSVQIYLVGGAVRDIMLGKPVHDFDFVIEGLVRPVGKKLANAVDGKFYVLDDQRDMVRVILNHEKNDFYCIDIAQISGNTLEEDLYARDFTINAMAIDFIQKNKVIDPMGGAADLKEKRLRMCNLESLKSDPLRGMRAIRMAVEYDLSMDAPLIDSLNEIVPYLTYSSMERYRDELFKILAIGKGPVSLQLLKHYGFLDFLFPGSGTTDEYTMIETVRSTEHLLKILTRDFNEAESSNLISGLAVLKLGAFRESLKDFYNQTGNSIRDRRVLIVLGILIRAIHSSGAGQFTDKTLKERAQHLMLSTAEIQLLTKCLNAAQALTKLNSTEKISDTEIFRYFNKFGSAGIDGLLLYLAALHMDKDILQDSSEWSARLDIAAAMMDGWINRADDVVKPHPLLTGDQISEKLNLPAGPNIGKIKQAVLEAQIEKRITTEEEALTYARTLL